MQEELNRILKNLNGSKADDAQQHFSKAARIIEDLEARKPNSDSLFRSIELELARRNAL